MKKIPSAAFALGISLAIKKSASTVSSTAWKLISGVLHMMGSQGSVRPTWQSVLV